MLLPHAASATVPSDLCTGNPCNVTGSVTVDEGSLLDFGAATDLRLKSTAILTVGPGVGLRDITLVAGSITLEPGARILGNGDGAAVFLEAVAGAIDLQASGSNISRILVRSLSGGTIDLKATGNVTVSGTLDAAGSGIDGIGGSIGVTSGGAVAFNREVEIGGEGSFNSGGDLSVAAESGIAVNGIIDGAGSGDGATIDLFTTTGDITVGAKIDVSGGAPEGLGGSVDLTAPEGNVSINALIIGNGGTGEEESCGDGGELNVTAGLAASLGTTAADVTLNAGTQCFGGSITIVAGTTFTQQTGAEITAQGPGMFGGGGALTVQTGADITLRNINFVSPGSGGFLDLRASSGTISFLGNVDARGTGTFGIGGFTDVVGCNVTVASGAKLDTRGNFVIPQTGVNVLRAGGTMTIAGQLLASSENRLEVKSGTPTITGTVSPAANSVVNPDLQDCVELAACGDGNLDPGEFCDDNNIADCDGCHADCQRADDVCGDGTRECGEQCDDGNTEDDDGCNADCTLPGTAGVRFVGSVIATAGCLAEWEVKLADAVINPVTSFPRVNQECVDGDPGCDSDGFNNFACTFEARICLRVPDPRIPTCSAAPIEYVTLKNPDSFTQGPLVDRDNAMRIVDALTGLGGQVRMAGNVLQSGAPLSPFDNCSNPFSLVVPRAPTGTKTFNILAHDTDNVTMSSNQIRLECLPNTAVCGNGVREPTELCDDGNLNSCDGCSPTCMPESCGDGVIQCGEQCDLGTDNGTPGGRCSSTCRELPPELRIPGGGSKALDCGIEFSAELNPARVQMDRKGIPKTLQNCVDNDPACDLDPTPGTCRVRVWVCAGGSDSRLACAAAAMEAPQVLSPNARALGTALAARVALTEALDGLPNPAGPGEVCTSRFEVDVPLGPRGLTLKPKMRFFGTKKADQDTLKIRCVAPLT